MSKKIRNTFLLAAIFLAGCYGFVFYSYKYGYLYHMVPPIIVFLMPVLIYALWVSDRKVSRWLEIGRAVVMVGVIALIYCGLSMLQDNYKSRQLKQYGVIAYAKVIGLKEHHGRYSWSEAIIFYKCQDSSYFQSIDNGNHFYNYNDSLKLICSSHDPELFNIKGYKPAVDIKN